MNKKSVEKNKPKKQPKIKFTLDTLKKNNKVYFSYTTRMFICAFSFVILIGLSCIFFFKTFEVEKATVINYRETGSFDYKVYIRKNEFYETPYLGKNMVYIASLIENINIDLNYQFLIDEKVNTDITYNIVAKLTITTEDGKNVLYEKEYPIKENQKKVLNDVNAQFIKDNVVIDYNYYNELANRFKATYGVGAKSELTVYMRIKKAANNDSKTININESSEMNLKIPLSQKTLNITINDTGINNNKSIINESKVNFDNIFCGVLCSICFIGGVAFTLKTLELLFVMMPKKSKYDKYIEKLLREYDRLIVETPTEPRFEGKEQIKIKRFEELLDARDNFKRPIMYYNLIAHQKCYFYIEVENTMYLLVIKAVDLDEKQSKKTK